MFADLVGSTALSAQLDPEDLRDLLATYHRMVSEVVKAHGGHVAQYLGDGALIYFGYPMSHEDDGERALKTGLCVGKSRLTAAARDKLYVSEDRIVTYFCSQSFTNTALFPVVRYISRTCGLSSEDSPAARRQKLQNFLGPLGTPDALALLSELLSTDASDEFDAIAHLSPAERRKATFDLLIRHSASLTQEGPLAIVFEDIHWADPSTLEFLDLLIAKIEAHRILLIATFRPEFQPTWVGLANVTLLTVSRLARVQQRRLIEAVAGSSDLLPLEVMDEIAERTDGVPLFLEELRSKQQAAAMRSPGPLQKHHPFPLPCMPRSWHGLIGWVRLPGRWHKRAP
jgi:class 3 adenylate cyclase